MRSKRRAKPTRDSWQIKIAFRHPVLMSRLLRQLADEVIAIPVERPRHQSMMMSSQFLALRRGLMSLIREESLRAIGGEVNEIAMQGLGIDLAWSVFRARACAPRS